MKYISFYKASVGDEEIVNLKRVMRSGWLTTGRETLAFEKSFARYQDVPWAVGLTSCTAALHLSLLACGIKQGDEVVTSPFTFASSASVILHAGAEARFVDVREEDFTMDMDKLERALTRKTKGVIPVHYAGALCDLERLEDIKRKRKLAVVQDAAHCIEGQWKGKSLSRFGDTACFSFYVTKNITTGEGGMVVTRDKKTADRIRLLSLHGLSRDAWSRYRRGASVFYSVLLPGYKYNMFDIQAAIGRAQMKKLDLFYRKRKALDALYREHLGDIDGIRFQLIRKGTRHAHHLFVVDLNTRESRISRDSLMNVFRRSGIGFSVHFVSLHLHPYYKKRYGLRASDFPVAARLSREIISLPFYPGMEESEVKRVALSFKKAFGKKA